MQPVKLDTPGGTLRVGIESGGKLSGVPLQIHTHEGVHYIAGVPGARYSITVRNLTHRRVEVITSIDGRNTLKNEEADYNANHGLVIPPRGSYRFSGWRLDNEGVREFIFGSDIDDSVVSQAGGDTANAGVIGIAAWREFEPPQPVYPRRDSFLRTQYRSSGPGGQSVTSSVPVATASAGATMDWNATDESSNLSTGIGDYHADRVGTTSFTRGEGPDILAIHYMSYSRLVEKGIIVEPAIIRPIPFPGSSPSGYENMQPPSKSR